MDRLRSKFVGSLVGTGVGDSLGAGGRSYTDDTAMMIGVAESLIEKGRFNAEHRVQVFVRNYDAEPWRGYGPGPPNIFRMIKSHLSWKTIAEKMYPGGSYGNGSAMRVAPIGLFHYDDSTELKEISCQSSQITHTHPLGMERAALQVYAVALATKTEPKRLNKRNFLQKLE
jgi:poly(ADP-ribose) glycohydrolase ARH3